MPAVVLMCGLSGCFFGGGKPSCNKPQEYQVSESIEALQVPDGLDQPDRSAALIIPEASPGAKAREADDPCLDSPPDYFGR
ncbi:MAG: hypothetical protein QGH93_04255 [Gammaproteobacteria bacterium]|jgi:hypothetical protein|nr:hypothetical protein [Chromatiales bacterium]MDP6674048.1 hypothetical protein [Gammaproteobacteria bacterium]